MMKVKLIDDDFSNCPEDHVLYKVMLVGDEIPEINKIYTVKTICHFKNGILAYELEELDYSAYPNGIAFNSERFEVISNEYVVNAWSNRFNCAVMEYSIYYEN